MISLGCIADANQSPGWPNKEILILRIYDCEVRFYCCSCQHGWLKKPELQSMKERLRLKKRNVVEETPWEKRISPIAPNSEVHQSSPALKVLNLKHACQGAFLTRFQVISAWYNMRGHTTTGSTCQTRQLSWSQTLNFLGGKHFSFIN